MYYIGLNTFKALFFVVLLCSQHASGKGSPKKILFLGDSLTAGYNIAKAEAFPSLIGKSLEKLGYKNVETVNAGISGSTTASGTSRIRWHLRSKIKPSIVVVALGANDGLRGQKITEVKKNLLETVRLAKSNGISVLLAGMKIPPNYGKKYTSEFEAVFPDIAKSESVQLIPFLLEGVAARPELNLPDGIHPNPKGHVIIAKNVLKYLRPMLKEAKQLKKGH